MRYGAAKEAHGFDRVYFWEPRTGMQQIHRRGQKQKRFNFDLRNGYPSRGMRLWSSGQISTTAEGEQPLEYDFGEVDFRRVIIPPNDIEFRLHAPNKKPLRCRLKATAYSDRIDMNPEFF